MTATLTLSLEFELSAAEAFARVTAELAPLLADAGLDLETGAGGGIVELRDEGRVEVATVREWVDGERIVLDWRAADWRDERAEVELRFEPAGDGTRIVFEHRGWGAAINGPAELAGWFTDRALAPLLEATAPTGLGRWLTDRQARRPTGPRARTSYRDPKEHRPGFELTLGALALQADDVLIEVGCGGGAFMTQALETGCRAVAVDHSAEMVDLTAETNAGAVAADRLDVRRADAAALPFGDGSFTAYAMTHAFFFLDDPVGALREARRVLTPDGRAAIYTAGPELRGTPGAPEPVARWMHLYAPGELDALAREAGFASVAVQAHGGANLLVVRP